jgi:cytochrome P450/deferrochelatase/peroxidase EfeB
LSKPKYFDAIRAAQAQSQLNPDPRLDVFDFTSIAPKTWSAKLMAALAAKALQPIYAIGRAFFPVMHLAGIYHITRDAQVRDVLSRPDTFCVPFGLEMAELAGGSTFALGLDGGEHTRQNALLRKVIKPAEDQEHIAALTNRFANAFLDNSHGKIDAINDLIKGTVSEICIRYFGFVVDDRDAFADWTISASALLFGDPMGNPKVRELALNGSARLRAVFDASIQRAQLLRQQHPKESNEADTIVDRLVALQHEQEHIDPISDDQIRAILFGLVSGFIPTNTLAAGKMLDVLVRRPQAFQLAVAAARNGKEGREDLKRILLEAGRLNPTLSPGQWRYCPAEASINVGKETKIIPAGSLLMVSTMSAMRDKSVFEAPGDFVPDRRDRLGNWQEPDLLFGGGVHHCIGKYLAIEQITETFMVLLSKPGLRPASGKAGKLQSIGPFCRNLNMVFDTPTSQQAMFLILATVTSGASKAEIDAEISQLGHPATNAVSQGLDKTGIVHFCSLSTIQSDTRTDIIWELSVDGDAQHAIAAIVARVGNLIRPLFVHSGCTADEDLSAFLVRHVVKLHGKPWDIEGGATGLNFKGTGEFPIATIAKQARFATFVEKVLADFLNHDANRGNHAMLAMAHVRRILNQDRILLVSGTPNQRALMQEANEEAFDAYQLLPSTSRLELSKFKDLSPMQGLKNFLRSPDFALIWVPALVLALLYAGLFAVNMNFSNSAHGLWVAISLLLASLSATALTLITIPILLLLAIRAAEKRDLPNDTQAPLSHIKAIEKNENVPGYAQNHIMAVGTLKPGLLRLLTHTFALWGIRVLIESKFRPGFVKNMGTIHYARWWRVPGTNRAAFFSNFDGSWESYLEDFVTRTSYGMTAAWSNWRGFPPTKFLIFKGATDGGRFKRWVRTQQQVVPFWYSRFPSLTTDHIRNNALIHRGVAGARNNSEAEEWLRCFGSMPRVENKIEADEVQALVFTGLKRLIFSASIPIQLPPAGERVGEWLSWILGDTQSLDKAGAFKEATSNPLAKSGVIVPVYDRDGIVSGYALANSLTVTFGDRPLVADASNYDLGAAALAPADGLKADQRPANLDEKRMSRRAVFFGCSGSGMAKFDPPNMGSSGLSDLFPPAFQLGMAARGRNLGDLGDTASSSWRWGDTTEAGQAAEAILIVYAETSDDLAYATQVHTNLLEHYGGKVIAVTDCAPARLGQGDDQLAFEHFGYRDGISQPIVKGTQRSLKGAPERDIVEPGEFILGYANGQGFFSQSPLLPPDADLGRNLPQLSSKELSRFPDFGNGKSGQSPRDFGRNGTYLVVRELKQDVAGFENFVTRKADDIRQNYRDIHKVIGQYPDKEWIKAKLMGRWPNGRPLIGNPVNTPSPKRGDPDFAACRAAERENDFAYGSDDPQGLACPFGSHIRRTNPRDSKEPGDKAEQVITNRHRLLRRGRTYSRTDASGEVEKGILFVALCTDLERQFEFVQQIWSNSPSFHGLTNEPDPISGADMPDPKTGKTAARHFTIPTPAGSMKLLGMETFVRVMAGGYFFLPSRSALTFLTEVSLHRKVA